MAVFTTIGAAVFGAGTFLAGITAAALQVAAGIGLSLIAKSLAGEAEGSKFGVQGKLQGGDDTPRSVLFGYNCTAGSFVYGNTWGTANGVQNAYLTQVIALADFPIRELVSVEVNGANATLNTASPHPQYGIPVNEFRKGNVDHLWIKFYDGTQTSADSYLTGTVSSTERPYPSNRVGFGIPYIIATSMAPERKDGEETALFNGFPTFKFVTNGTKLYDISRDTTQGGSGNQRWDNPATWGGDGDFLPAVQIYNLLRGIKYSNQWLYGLQNLSATRLPAANWILMINKCRALIDGPNGMEPTYRTGGELQVGAQIKVAIEAILTGCEGRLTEIGGTYKLNLGDPDAAVISFTDLDILSTEEQSFTPFFSLEDTINGVQATYPNPNEGWNTKTAPPLIRTDLEILDGNRRLMADVSLDMVPYIGQVQRLMRSSLLSAQRARRHTIVMGPEFWILEPGDIIQWSSERNGYIDKLFRVDGISDRGNLDVMIDMTEVDPNDYDWNQNTDFRPVVDGPIQLVGAPALPMIGWQVYAVAIKDSFGRNRRPAIEIAYQSGLQDVIEVKFQVRVFGTEGIFLSGQVPYGEPWRTVIQGDFPPDSEFEVRGIFVRGSGGVAEWSDWLYVKTLNIKLTGGLDFDPYGDVDINLINEEFKGFLTWLSENTREVLRQAQELATASTDEILANYSQHQTIRREIVLTSETTKASYLEAITVATGPGSAIVSRIEVLEVQINENIATAVELLQTQIAVVDGRVTATADSITALDTKVGNFSASGKFRVTTVSTEAGAEATIGLSVAVSDGAAATSAALFLSAVSGGVSRVSIEADQFVVRNGNAIQQPFVFISGIASLNVANIGLIRAGRMESGDGKFVIDLNSKRISIST